MKETLFTHNELRHVLCNFVLCFLVQRAVLMSADTQSMLWFMSVQGGGGGGHRELHRVIQYSLSSMDVLCVCPVNLEFTCVIRLYIRTFTGVSHCRGVTQSSNHTSCNRRKWDPPPPPETKVWLLGGRGRGRQIQREKIQDESEPESEPEYLLCLCKENEDQKTGFPPPRTNQSLWNAKNAFKI